VYRMCAIKRQEGLGAVMWQELGGPHVPDLSGLDGKQSLKKEAAQHGGIRASLGVRYHFGCMTSDKSCKTFEPWVSHFECEREMTSRSK
jgi:hypothetical protein